MVRTTLAMELSPLEITAVVFGLLSVGFTIRQSIWCWPTGLVNVVLYILIFYQARLFSDVVLQVIYVPLQLYGWWHWLAGDKGTQELPVTRLTTAARDNLGGRRRDTGHR